MEDFINLLSIEWSEEDYYTYFRKIGTRIQTLSSDASAASE